MNQLDVIKVALREVKQIKQHLLNNKDYKRSDESVRMKRMLAKVERYLFRERLGYYGVNAFVTVVDDLMRAGGENVQRMDDGTYQLDSGADFDFTNILEQFITDLDGEDLERNEPVD